MSKSFLNEMLLFLLSGKLKSYSFPFNLVAKTALKPFFLFFSFLSSLRSFVRSFPHSKTNEARCRLNVHNSQSLFLSMEDRKFIYVLETIPWILYTCVHGKTKRSEFKSENALSALERAVWVKCSTKVLCISVSSKLHRIIMDKRKMPKLNWRHWS